jgi:hypothetical protein
MTIAEDFWVGTGAGNWTTAADWDLGSGGSAHAPPTSTQDAFIQFLGSAVVASDSNETVNSIGTNLDSALFIENDSTFIATNGTTLNAGDAGTTASGNIGNITVFDGSELQIGQGTFDNSGTVELNSGGTLTSFAVANSVMLTGGGTVEMSPNSNNFIKGAGGSSSLTNVNNTISGGGQIGAGLNALAFTNGSGGTIETNNSLGTGTLQIVGSDNGGSFTNKGTVEANDGGTLVFGKAGDTGSINNEGLVELSGSTKTTTLQIVGTVQLTGGGKLVLGGSFSDDDFIEPNGSSATLDNMNNTISGGGQIGDGSTKPLTVDNEGVFDADGSTPYPMYFFPSTVVNDGGTLEATNRGGLSIADGAINNTGGTIQATGGGVVGIAFETITGSGSIFIGQNSELFLDDVTITGSVQYTGPNASIFIETPTDGALSQIDGGILGAQATDTLDLNYVPYSLSVHAVWQQTSSTVGTLSLYSHGADLATFDLAGQFTSLNFVVSKDTSSGTLITVQNTPSYAENPGNNDEWILSDGNWVESAGPGSHPSGYNVALTGDWTGNGTDGILWFNPTTGDTDEWQLSNTQWSASVDLGTHPANPDGNSYQIAGTDGASDFTGNGIDDVLWTSTNSDGTIATDTWQLASSGKWSASVSPGTHPAGYSVAGTGDWTGSSTDGILWFNSSTGDTDEWQLSGGNWAASIDLGTHPTNSTDGASYQIAGTGDFFGNGRDGVLWTSVNSDGTIATDIWELTSSGQWMASVSPGNHPAGYSVAGVGDFTGTGTSDILWYNASTGDTDEWLINNGAYAGHVDLGTHPGGFQIAGVGDFNGAGNAGVLWHSNS